MDLREADTETDDELRARLRDCRPWGTTMRILIAGGPRTGKTQRANELLADSIVPLDTPLRCTDEVITRFDWAGASLEVASWIHDPGPWIIEGTIVLRALRHYLLQTRMTDKPADVLYYGALPMIVLTKNQTRMLDGCNTIWNGIRSELMARGTRVEAIPRKPVTAA